MGSALLCPLPSTVNMFVDTTDAIECRTFIMSWYSLTWLLPAEKKGGHSIGFQVDSKTERGVALCFLGYSPC